MLQQDTVSALFMLFFPLNISDRVTSMAHFHESIQSQVLRFVLGHTLLYELCLILIDREFEPRSDQTKDYKIGFCFFSSKHAALRNKSNDWLDRNQNNVSEWSDMSIRGLLLVNLHYKNPTKHVGLVQSGTHHHLIEN